jgi:hypothetical protein
MDTGESTAADPRERVGLSKALEEVLESLQGQDTTLGGLLEKIGERGFGLLFLLLALPAALPVPAPGYATPFGIVMALLSVQMVLGRKAPWLPAFLARRTLSFSVVSFSIRQGGRVLGLVEWLVRPRWSRLSRNRFFLAAIAVVMLLMSLFMTLPIPLTNTAPSFVIFVLAAGILEEDGLVLLGGLLLAPVAACIACLALYYGLTLGLDAVEGTLKPLIRGWFNGG